jgi:hypothetical protein
MKLTAAWHINFGYGILNDNEISVTSKASLVKTDILHTITFLKIAVL